MSRKSNRKRAAVKREIDGRLAIATAGLGRLMEAPTVSGLVRLTILNARRAKAVVDIQTRVLSSIQIAAPHFDAHTIRADVQRCVEWAAGEHRDV